jgi:hypothetical protein
MAPATWLQGYGNRYGPVKVKQGFFSFLLRQFLSPWFWLLFLATLAATLLFGWRGWLRNRIFWGIR